MRITGGSACGRIITAPKGLDVRPTASKVRQAIFNILNLRLADCRFLDLFSGSGLMGLEALSRGAQSVTFVEESHHQIRTIEDNLALLGFKATVLRGDVCRALPSLKQGAFDIIFADPPYKSNLPINCIKAVDTSKLLSADGIFVIEHLRGMEMPDDLKFLVLKDTRAYGQTAVSFFVPATSC